jgi:hypothetical protein
MFALVVASVLALALLLAALSATARALLLSGAVAAACMVGVLTHEPLATGLFGEVSWLLLPILCLGFLAELIPQAAADEVPTRSRGHDLRVLQPRRCRRARRPVAPPRR